MLYSIKHFLLIIYHLNLKDLTRFFVLFMDHLNLIKHLCILKYMYNKLLKSEKNSFSLFEYNQVFWIIITIRWINYLIIVKHLLENRINYRFPKIC